MEDVEGLDRFGQITGNVRALEFLIETMYVPSSLEVSGC